MRVAGHLKQRLTGALVLLVGAAVLWPLVFDDPYSSQVDTRSAIPAEPPVGSVVVAVPEPLHDDLPLETGRHAPLPEPLEGSAWPESAAAASPAAEPAPKPAPKPETKPATKPSLPATGSGSQLALDSRGLPERWTVQLGSFRDEAAALALKKALVAKGHPAYLRPVQSAGVQYVRVFVGPKVDRAAAEKLQQSLNRDFKVQSIVVRYDP